MTEKAKLVWLYGLSALFIVLNTVAIVCEFYWLSLLPVILIILGLFLFSIDKLLLLIVFMTPLAINLQDTDFGVGVSLPTEPLLFGVMLMFIFKVLFEGTYDKKVLKHPVTTAILINLVWLLITSCTSSIPSVSFKFLTARLWFIIAFYFIATQLFKDVKNIKRFLWLYIIPLIIVIGYTFYNHLQWNMTQKAANWVMTPFYNDHTAYGAILAMFLPVIYGFATDKDNKKWIQTTSWIIGFIFLLAITFSYSRAAWVSLAVALIVFLVIIVRIKFRTILLIFAGLGVFLFIYREDLFNKMEKNKEESSTDLATHVGSISNITSDASNLERMNRWACAWRMFKEKPILGWGPGTYQFKYAPFQLSKDRTIISTNLGDRGNAHSEYIGPLAESGLLGSISFIAIILTVMYTAFKLFYNLQDKKLKRIVVMLLLGIITYIVHGALNNFLDTDKASVPFWGFIATIVAIDLYYKEQQLIKK